MFSSDNKNLGISAADCLLIQKETNCDSAQTTSQNFYSVDDRNIGFIYRLNLATIVTANLPFGIDAILGGGWHREFSRRQLFRFWEW